uniref:Uncharacterized protein n=1 Tax=Hyaloperonospora arabidopsidis (strain Emoy2) TaxID=559515 RepID=M4BEG3_HYAAE
MAEATAAQHEFALSSMLILPDSFGYISVINPYSCELRDVRLSANIQCANDRVELHDNRFARAGKMPPTNPVAVLPAGSGLDMVVDYPLNQVGNHVLRNPMVITFKQSPPMSTHQQHGEVIVEAQIRNVSKLPLFVDSIKFLPLPPFVAKEMQVASSRIKKELDQASIQDLLSVDDEPQTLVYPQEELQRVFHVSYDPTSNPALLTTQGSQNLGRLHVGWKTSMGEAGSVQSPPLMREISEAVGQNLAGAGDVVVSVEEIPSKVVVGQPFVVAISVTNKSLQRLALQVQFRKELMHGIVCSSASHQNIGVMEAKTTQTIWVEFLAVVGGLRILGAPVCVDIQSRKEFTQAAALAHVLVAPS